jgi:hypothetical protein
MPIKRDQSPVIGCLEYFAVAQASAAIGWSTASQFNAFFVLVVPNHDPSARIKGGYVIVGSGDKHLPVNHQRVSLERPNNASLVQPFGA